MKAASLDSSLRRVGSAIRRGTACAVRRSRGFYEQVLPGLVLACAALLLASRPARADPATFSSFERQIIARELARRNAELAAQPEHKLVESIEIVTLDVFDETDPIPDFVNFFHVTTRSSVIRRELLFRAGEPYRQRQIDESERNLRSTPSLPQLSLVLILPVKGSDAEHVRVLVITKDVWSLRLNWSAALGPDGLTYLYLNPSEFNLFGTHASAGGSFVLQRSSYAVGARASDARIFGTRLYAAASASIVFERATGRAEGSFGGFSYGKPRYTEFQRWSYGTSARWYDEVVRVNVAVPSEAAEGAFPLRAERVFQLSRALFAYRSERFSESASLTRSFGVRHKLDLTLGAEADRRAYRSLVSEDFPENVRAAFVRREIPVQDTRIGPYVRLRKYDNDFLKTIELETLGLQEEVRLGPEVLTKLYAAGRRLGSSRDLLGLFSGAAYTLRVGDGFVRALAASNIEYSDKNQRQAMFSAALRVSSPRLGFGRLIFDGVLENRYQNYLREKSALGGNGRLRGYASADTEAAGSGELRGPDLFVMNTEFRSRGIEILSAQCGLAAFYDAGGAATRMGDLRLKHSVGAGLRFLLPWLDRVVFRADWAFPLNDDRARPLPGALFFTAGQAFLVPTLAECLSCTTEPRSAPYGLSDVTW